MIQTTINGERVDIITLRWDSKCAKCGATIAAGTQACWYPKSKWSHGGVRYRRTVTPLTEGANLTQIVKLVSNGHMVGTVTHRPDAPCASEYTVKAIYESTSKVLLASAMTAEQALERVAKQLGSRQCKPSAYIVYQGNVTVMTRTA